MKNVINFKTLSILLWSIFTLACSNKEDQKEKVSVRPVNYQKVESLDSKENVTYSGIAKTEKVTHLSFRGSGILTDFDIKMGQKVKKGQTLGKLDNVSARLMLEQAIARKNAAKSEYNTAKSNLDRVKNLYTKNSVSLSDFEMAKNTFKSAEQNYEAAKNGVDLQKEQVQFGYLYAPEDGEISSIHVELNENISPGQPIATLNSGTAMEIEFGVPENQINRINNYDTVIVLFSALANQSYKGIITEIAPSVSQNSSVYPIKLSLLNQTQSIKSGMAAKVTLSTKNTGNLIEHPVVPIKSVSEDYNGKFVFVVEHRQEAAFVRKTTVETGEATDKGFKILKGLQVGQYIATAGLQTLVDGQQIKRK